MLTFYKYLQHHGLIDILINSINAKVVMEFVKNNFSVPYKLSLDTVDNIMKVSQMIIQGLWFQKSPLLQLPHVTEDMLRHFVTKRV